MAKVRDLASEMAKNCAELLNGVGEPLNKDTMFKLLGSQAETIKDTSQKWWRDGFTNRCLERLFEKSKANEFPRDRFDVLFAYFVENRPGFWGELVGIFRDEFTAAGFKGVRD